MSKRVVFFGILVAAVLLSSPARAGMDTISKESDLPYHIKADSLDYDEITMTYRARGFVTIARGDQFLHADAADFNEQTGDAKAWGDVRFFSGKDWLTGSRMEINLDDGTGTVYDGTIFIEESHFYVRGNEIQKTGKNSYYIKDHASLTTCDGDSPDWQITGRDFKVTIEGYGTVKHAALWAKSVPVLYAPFILFPAKIKRQTGLLVPLVLYSNTNGFEYIQPFFWAISESSDATFYEHYMAHRGFKHGVEYRYVLSPGAKGTAMYDFLYDEQIDDGTTPVDPQGYYYEGFKGDSEDRLNRKRWWFRTKSDWELPAQFKAKLDVDVVSDQDYLREFDTGYSGYEFSNKYFEKEFGRGLDDETDTVRLNQLNLNRTWDQFSLNTDLLWYDDVLARIHHRDDTTLQSLPSVSFSGSKQKILDSPFYFDLSSSLNHYWRETGTRGYTVDLSPKVYYPISVFKYFDFEPSVGLRETLWQAEEYDPPSAKKEDQLRSREICDLKADLSTEISRVFHIRGSTIDKIRHAIRPQVVYTYVPDVEQGDLPDFVSSISETNSLSYSVTNTFTSRRIQKADSEREAELEAKAWGAWAADTQEETSEADDEQESLPPKYSYHDFCRISLSQTYDILTARRPPPADGERRPLSDISGRLELNLFQSVDLDFVGNITWSPYDGEYKSYDAAVVFSNSRGDEASLDYRYTQDSSKSILTKVFVNLFDPLSVYWEHERDLHNSKEIESVLGFRYEPQCWSLYVKYTHDCTMNTREYSFEISLYGLGKYGLGSYRPGKGKDTWMKKG